MFLVDIGKMAHDLEKIPGTEILLQSDGSSVQSHDGQMFLVPEPSDQPDDPLVSKSEPRNIAMQTNDAQNWSPTWKAIVIINQAIFVFISVLTPLSIAPLTPIFIMEFKKSLAAVNMARDYPLLPNVQR